MVETLADQHGVILVIEDDAAYAEGLALLMHARGLPCVVVRDADGAAAALADQSRKVVAALLDIGLYPYWNARDAFALLKAHHLPVVVLSGSISDAEEAALLAAGAGDVVRKATDLYVLIVRLRRALERDAPASRHLLPPFDPAAPAAILERRVLAPAPLLFDAAGRQVLFESRVARFTERESLILERLFAASGDPVSAESLIATIPEPRDHLDRRAIEVTISRIRAKLRVALGQQAATRLATCRLRGYRITGPVLNASAAGYLGADPAAANEAGPPRRMRSHR